MGITFFGQYLDTDIRYMYIMSNLEKAKGILNDDCVCVIIINMYYYIFTLYEIAPAYPENN